MTNLFATEGTALSPKLPAVSATHEILCEPPTQRSVPVTVAWAPAPAHRKLRGRRHRRCHAGYLPQAIGSDLRVLRGCVQGFSDPATAKAHEEKMKAAGVPATFFFYGKA